MALPACTLQVVPGPQGVGLQGSEEGGVSTRELGFSLGGQQPSMGLG